MDQDELWLKVSYVRENVQTGQTITCITEVCKYLEIALGFTGQNDNWIGTILMIGNSSQAVPVNQLQSWIFFKIRIICYDQPAYSVEDGLRIVNQEFLLKQFISHTARMAKISMHVNGGGLGVSCNGRNGAEE